MQVDWRILHNAASSSSTSPGHQAGGQCEGDSVMSQFNVSSRPVGRIALASVLSIVLGWTAAFAQARTFHFDIPERTLSEALREFGRVSGQEIIFTEDLVHGVHVASLRGDFTADSALERLLKGTGLSAERSASGALMIRRQTNTRTATESNP